MSAARAPALLCLNLRLEHVNGTGVERAAAVLARAGDLLATYRHMGFAVLHAHRVRPRSRDILYGALPGFEPDSLEPVFALKRNSALEEDQVLEIARTHDVSIVGAAFSRTGLATLLAARAAGVHVSVAAEACFTPAIDPLPAREVLNAIVEPAIANTGTTWGNVICLKSRRP